MTDAARATTPRIAGAAANYMIGTKSPVNISQGSQRSDHQARACHKHYRYCDFRNCQRGAKRARSSRNAPAPCAQRLRECDSSAMPAGTIPNTSAVTAVITTEKVRDGSPSNPKTS